MPLQKWTRIALLSLAPLIGPGASAENVNINHPPPLPPTTGSLIEDFAASIVGEFPKHWHPKGKDGIHFYRVLQSEERKYLAVDAIRLGNSIFREVEWDINKYPILEWAWRGRVLPENGNEKNASTNDCAVALYIVFPKRFPAPFTLKYVWSTTLPVGEEFANGVLNRNKIRVVRSGNESLGKWVVEQRNIAEDYRRRFSRKPQNPIAIGVITDADATNSASSGDYGYFRLLPP